MPDTLYSNKMKCLFRCSSWKLHGEAVYGTVLADDGAGIDGQRFAVGERFGNHFSCSFVFGWLVVGGNEYALIDNKEIGVGGG